jgi:hypothetical protein
MSSVLGYLIMFMQVINNSPNDVAEFPNMVYLLIHRPSIMTGFTMIILPILVALPQTPCYLLK